MSNLEIQALGNESISTVIGQVALSRWSSAVSLTILIYDTLLTLDDEIELLWPKKLSIIKVLTHLNRITALACILLNAQHLVALKRSFSNEFCEISLIATGVAAFLSFAMCNWILLARTKALFADSRPLAWGLSIFFVLTYAGTCVLVLKSSLYLIGQIFYSRTIRVCGIASRPPTLGFVWVAPMVFETTIFVLTIYKLYKKAASTYEAGSNLLLVLYRDGVVYYIVIICLRIFNLVAWMAMPTPFVLVGIFLLWAVMTIAVTRLQINLVKAVDPNQPLSSSSFLPGLHRTAYSTRAQQTSRHTHIGSRYAPHIQMYSIKESRQPTQIRIETSVQTVTFQDEDWHNGRGSKASRRMTEENAANMSSTTLEQDSRRHSHHIGYAL